MVANKYGQHSWQPLVTVITACRFEIAWGWVNNYKIRILVWTIPLNIKYVGICSDFFTLCRISDFMKDRTMSWYWKHLVFANGYRFQKDVLISLFIVFVLYTCGNAQTQYLLLQLRHIIAGACRNIAGNRVGSMHEENKTKWISLRLRQSMYI